MCEFCHQHGEGKIWYLQAKNYADELANDLRRKRSVGEFLHNFEKEQRKNLDRMRQLPRAPKWVQSLIRRFVTQHQKKVHFGQVVPIEDVEAILSMMNHVVRVPCLCRRVIHSKEVRCCYGISISPNGHSFRELVDPSYWNGPDGPGAEVLDKSAALEAMHGYERQGLMHSVWTFGTPFIAGICNCSPQDCLAAMSTDTYGLQVMFRAEYVAVVDPLKCNGCRACQRRCPFELIGDSERKAVIDPTRCYGCGVCRTACKADAISLLPRNAVPEAAGVW